MTEEKRHNKHSQIRNISFVIPIFNEEEILSTSISRLLQSLKDLQVKDFELFLVNNGSTDRTPEILRRLENKYPEIKTLQLPEANFGQAIRLGLEVSRHEFVVLFNVDWWDMKFLTSAYELRRSADIIIASKRLQSSKDQRPLLRRIGTTLLALTIQIFFSYKGSDTHGLKFMVRNEIIPLLKECRTDEIIETEMLIRAQRKGLRIKELTCQVREIRPSRMPFLTRSLKVIREVLLLSRFLSPRISSRE
ncbi:MAG: hypothetical protein A2785_01220 [Candidatus Chisholmbacteria bacterium RIFCSPHIGHO2_01_FULL_49_18]|uniref:Glycosyltransferase 2-like domain-containing protein n=1 Tax=Candidatus Chisholmbacteria bacterium RIFCSPHIGHO2_01_FULL_49_18 TaxID=1797590 RepID=A0A1G1VLZ5_9BACT|nr:MAG: hypothetical protein A2785_01220 [Candidatus Chisholmbacteria bacterium RIFCSPHIGHO2_01_FULL_49_18]